MKCYSYDKIVYYVIANKYKVNNISKEDEKKSADKES